MFVYYLHKRYNGLYFKLYLSLLINELVRKKITQTKLPFHFRRESAY